ncbi:DNA mismatch repair endonuclease MutL [Bacillus sp. ISL-40]|uniref:DNA mismatch repair endonuclease MutL n=1 Tax=unclassified Bacillus (in: firmicutes) TaxID=185979 RepID=UPI001BED2763|nr:MULTISPECIES: DNA mismatch repair endonuclease MutL [unclassified Bacillus (in: firmicutes)]MBT2700378.1 DNA mismatch repair endonuclease MutL [Bacillus sp. ISL-40]MBT2722272.1 DNA mismatch repair endonuclease MutL [Bacillus sp. ISL-46]MBT2742411.1 DNA mismatch repair endonuclease MutL [Bacillus sp. ISL-77]
MGKIIQLDDALSNKIAAGEVVERPASVVKELVENSIDAGSTVIEIEVEEAGLAKIRITDNGYGIEEEDVLLAFQRHATSKIKNENDLFRIRTLGFRGEALPSVASVSRLEMKTSTGEGAGNRLVIEGGKVETFEKASSRRGTDISITDLFFNTPARLKYMKTIHTELGNITDVVNRLALSHPEVAFRLIHNDRKLLQTNGNGDVRQVLASIYGMGIAKQLVPITGQSLDYKINGFASMPEVTRASRNYISTMINGRFIKNYPLAKAIQEGYHTLLPIGRFPIVLLNIEMDPLLVDVNVHPSKMEVRISKEAELNELVTSIIKEAFKSKILIPTAYTAVKKDVPKEEQTSLVLDEGTRPANDGKEFEWKQPVAAATIQETRPWLEVPVETPVNKLPSFQRDEATGGRDTWQSINPFSDSDDEPDDSNQTIEPNVDTVETGNVSVESRVPRLYPIGQMHGTYIFAQNENGLYIIDQHAAQERLKYEYFREKVGQVQSELQEMLVPLTFEYSTDEFLKINEYQSELEKVGVFLEEFGLNSFIVRSHPQWFPKGEEKQIIEDMIEQLLLMKKVDIKKLREEAAIMMSCKASIKANRHLRNDEIQALLDDLRKASDPFTCPHGRPIIVHYSVYEMEKMFKRVM